MLNYDLNLPGDKKSNRYKYMKKQYSQKPLERVLFFLSSGSN